MQTNNTTAQATTVAQANGATLPPVQPPVAATDIASAPALTPEQRQQLAQQDLMMSAAFARVVGILMRDPKYKHYFYR